MRIVSSTLLSALGVVLCMPLMAAEEAPAQTYVTALQFQVKPGMAPAYENLVRTIVKAHDQLETSFYWNASMVQFGEGGWYTFARWHDSLATVQADPRNYVRDAFGEDEAKRMAEGFSETIAQTRSGTWRQLPEYSIMPGEGMQPVNLMLLQVTVKPFANEKYEQYLARSVEASRAVEPEASYVAYAPMWGAENVYTFVTPLPNMTELGPTPKSVPMRLVEHFGQREADRLLDERDALVLAQNTVLAVSRPDLSRPAPQ